MYLCGWDFETRHHVVLQRNANDAIARNPHRHGPRGGLPRRDRGLAGRLGRPVLRRVAFSRRVALGRRSRSPRRSHPAPSQRNSGARCTVLGLHIALGDVGTMAYLAFVAERLPALKRVLKSTGTPLPGRRCVRRALRQGPPGRVLRFLELPWRNHMPGRTAANLDTDAASERVESPRVGDLVRPTATRHPAGPVPSPSSRCWRMRTTKTVPGRRPRPRQSALIAATTEPLAMSCSIPFCGDALAAHGQPNNSAAAPSPSDASAEGAT